MKKAVTKIYNAIQRNEDLKETFNSVLDILPERAETEQLLGELYEVLKGDHRLVEIVDLAIEREPENFQLYSYKATLVGKENPKLAIKTLSESLPLLHQSNDEEHDVTWTYLRIAELLDKTGEHEESIAACKLALEYYTEDEIKDTIYWLTYKFRGEQYLKLNQKDKARSDFLCALRHTRFKKDIINKIKEIDRGGVNEISTAK